MTKSSVDINVILESQTTTSQTVPQQFSKQNCSHKRAHSGPAVKGCRCQTDLTIALSAMDTAAKTNRPVAVVSRDTEVLIILLARVERGDMILVQPQPATLVNIQQMKTHLGAKLCCILLPLHDMTVCVTTSAHFRKGKKKSLLAKCCKEFCRSPATFNNKRSETDIIVEGGEKVMILVYNVNPFNNLYVLDTLASICLLGRESHVQLNLAGSLPDQWLC